MVKLIAMYEKPENEAAFFEHYENVHAPLAQKVPGLQKLVMNRVYADAFGREPRYVLIAEMHFPDRTTFDAAMKSPENRALGQDLMSFAKGIVTVLFADAEES
ncbi:MAG: EthD family reductase [Trueperaceae bacterium]